MALKWMEAELCYSGPFRDLHLRIGDRVAGEGAGGASYAW